MIARIWQGRTRPGMGKAYLAYLEQTGLKEYRATEGCKDVLVLTRGDPCFCRFAPNRWGFFASITSSRRV